MTLKIHFSEPLSCLQIIENTYEKIYQNTHSEIVNDFNDIGGDEGDVNLYLFNPLISVITYLKLA